MNLLCALCENFASFAVKILLNRKGRKAGAKNAETFIEDKKMKAIWNGAILAESDETIIVEGNHYFPADSINKEFFRPSRTHTVCGWKGVEVIE